jgi:hypothetical protein
MSAPVQPVVHRPGIGNSSVQLSIDRIKQCDPYRDAAFNEFTLSHDAKKVVIFLEQLHERAADLVRSIDNWRNVQPVNPQVQQDVERLRDCTAFRA